MSVHWVYQAAKVKSDSTTGDAENDLLPSISKVVLLPLQILGTSDAHMPFQRRCSRHPFTILNTPLTSYTNVWVLLMLGFKYLWISWGLLIHEVLLNIKFIYITLM